jgi:hypothetical protein
MTKYQIVFQGDLKHPNQEILEQPLSYDEAINMVTLLQADIFLEEDLSIKDIFNHQSFFVLVPIEEKPGLTNIN